MDIYCTVIHCNLVLLVQGNKHFALWEDPFKKPCYLFALVAGQLESRDDTFVTRSGRKVALRIWTPAQDVPKTAHAMYSLKAAMKWDEDVGFFMFIKIIGFDIKFLLILVAKFIVLCSHDYFSIRFSVLSMTWIYSTLWPFQILTCMFYFSF